MITTLARRLLPAWMRHRLRSIGAYAAAGLLPSRLFWPLQYYVGGTSGSGSRGRLAHFKARVLNDFVGSNEIRSVIEFGCGNGDQLSLMRYPNYIGFDISRVALAQCRSRFASDTSKSFRHLSTYKGEVADLALSLDVIFHLVEDGTYDDYMDRLFASANRYVIVYSSDQDDATWRYQYRHRKHSRWVAENRPDWRLENVVANDYPVQKEGSRDTSYSNFYIYIRR